MTYEIVFTPLAVAFAEAKSSVAEVEALVRKELAEMDCDPLEIFFHTVFVGDEKTSFICTPSNGKIEVDTCSYEETAPLESGPFKGQIVEIPNKDSE